MPVYLNGQKYIGAYMNGHKVNGCINGVKLFNYSYTATIKFEDTHNNNNVVGQTTATVYPDKSYSADDLAQNAIPSGYSEDYDPPAGNNTNKQTCNGNMTFIFYVYDNSGGGYIPYIPPASSASDNPQPSPAPSSSSSQPTIITRPIQWLVGDNPVPMAEFTGGSTEVSAPDGTTSPIDDLPSVGGSTVTPPEGYVLNSSYPFNFNDSTNGDVININLKVDENY